MNSCAFKDAGASFHGQIDSGNKASQCGSARVFLFTLCLNANHHVRVFQPAEQACFGNNHVAEWLRRRGFKKASRAGLASTVFHSLSSSHHSLSLCPATRHNLDGFNLSHYQLILSYKLHPTCPSRNSCRKRFWSWSQLLFLFVSPPVLHARLRLNHMYWPDVG
jgi:hypothetical protein